MGGSEEVGVGILRLLGTLKYGRNAKGQGDAAVCFSCGAVNDSGQLSLVELSGKKLGVFLRVLLVNEEDEKEICKRMEHPVRVCGACDKSLGTLIDRNQQLEDIRLEFCGVRRRMGRQMVLGPLGRPQESYGDWLRKVESVEDVFPSEVRRRLKKTFSVAVGTDEVVKIEEEEEFFDIIACNSCNVETDTHEQNKVDEPHKIGDLGGDNAAGPSDEHLSGRNFSLASTNSDVVTERGCKETNSSDFSESNTPKRRRRSVSKVKVVRPKSQVDTVDPGRGNRTKCDVKGSTEFHPTGLGTSTVDKTRVTLGGVSCDSLQTQTVGRPRRAMKKRVRYGESETEDGSDDEEDSEFLPSDDEIVSEKSEDAEFEDVGGTGQPSVACKPLTISRYLKQPKKSSGRSNYHPRCKFCPKVFKGYDTYRRHCYLHHKEDYLKDIPFACLFCYHVFSSAMSLQVHQKKHESQKCRFCGKLFLKKRDLIEHMRTHTGEKPYACDVCNRKFAHSCGLKVHMRTHTGEKPYACDVCNQKFSKNEHLKDHKNTHTGAKPFVCSCGQYFGNWPNMYRHKRTTGHS